MSLADVRSRVTGKLEGVVHTFVHGGVRVRFFVAVDVHIIPRVLALNGWKWAWGQLGDEVE